MNDPGTDGLVIGGEILILLTGLADVGGGEEDARQERTTKWRTRRAYYPLQQSCTLDSMLSMGRFYATNYSMLRAAIGMPGSICTS